MAHSGLIDQTSSSALQHLEKRQCIAVGNITSHYPLFIEIRPQTAHVWAEKRGGRPPYTVTAQT
ncbi:MAG: hypothetical protein ACXV46_08550, partial [Halobacteriota archaeon]